MSSTKIFRILLVTIAGIIAICRLLQQTDHKTVFDTLINTIISVIVISIFFWVSYNDWKAYAPTKSFYHLIPTITGAAFLLGFIITLVILDLRDKSPNILFAGYDGGYNGASIAFRKDGTYKLGNYCLGADYFRGKYTMKDSIIILDKASIDSVIVSNKLVIRSNTDTASQKFIYQVDEAGKELPNALVFTVYEDL